MLEVWLVLYALGLDSSLIVVGMVYAITSIANYLLMVLPAREGLLEGSSFLAFGLIGLEQASGFSFELVRRLRKIVYQGIGLLLMIALSRSQRDLPAVRET